jgi:hypothetical protein
MEVLPSGMSLFPNKKWGLLWGARVWVGRREAGTGSAQGLHQGAQLRDGDCRLARAALGSRHDTQRYLGSLG